MCFLQVSSSSLIHLGFLLFPCFFGLDLYFSVAALLLALSVLHSLIVCSFRCFLLFQTLGMAWHQCNGPNLADQKTNLGGESPEDCLTAASVSSVSYHTVHASEIQKTHQLRLIVYPIVYRVLAPSQVVNRISSINSVTNDSDLEQICVADKMPSVRTL